MNRDTGDFEEVNRHFKNAVNCAIVLVSLAMGLCAEAQVGVSVDKVAQRYPWNGLVDIDYNYMMSHD